MKSVLNKVVAIAVLIGVPALVATKAEAACSVPQNWSLTQSNGFTVRFQSIIQNGTKFSGFAVTKGTGGDVQGSLKKNGRLKFTISWGSGGAVGEDTAFVDDEDGSVSGGQTFDQRSPKNTASWFTRSTFPCS